MIFTLAARELRSLFMSPIAWVTLSVVQLLTAWLFLLLAMSFMLNQTNPMAAAELAGATQEIAMPLLYNAGVILLIATPFLGMRLISEERRRRTLCLLFSAPITMTEIVLGKYLALLAFLSVIMLLVCLMPLSLLAGTALDLGLLSAGVLGFFLLLGAYAAAALFMSSLVSSPTIAAIGTFGLLLLLWMIDGSGVPGATQPVLHYLSLSVHYQSFLRGIFNTGDAAYYLLFILLFLALSIRRLDANRLGG